MNNIGSSLKPTISTKADDHGGEIGRSFELKRTILVVKADDLSKAGDPSFD